MLLNFEIDKLTHSIENVISGDSFPTDVLPLAKVDLTQVTKKNGWRFNWKKEFSDPTKDVFKLVTKDNESVIQGLISITIAHDHVVMNLLENAPFNFGKEKEYSGVAGNLVAYACKESFQRGFDGYVAFLAKTKIIAHYEQTLGAVHTGGQLMIIHIKAATALVNKYFSNFKF